MSFRVIVPREVLDAIDAHMLHLVSEGAPVDRLVVWHARLFDLIDSLGDMPGRFPVAEAVTAATGYEVRRVNHGDYAILCRIDSAENPVELIAFRDGRRRPWLEDESEYRSGCRLRIPRGRSSAARVSRSLSRTTCLLA